MSEIKLAPYNDWPNDEGFDVYHEERTPIALTVTGYIPAYASGVLYRTGPGGYQVDTDQGNTFSMSHWFDGFTQIHRFQILAPNPDDKTVSQVLYNSRRSTDPIIENVRKTGDINHLTFGQKHDPCKGYFGKVSSSFQRTTPTVSDDNGRLSNIGVTISVNPAGFDSGDKKEVRALWTNTDASISRQLDPETLEPIGFSDQTKLLPELKGILSAAHAQKDPVTGDTFNYNLDMGTETTYRIFRASHATGKIDILATIKDAPGAYIHSFALTENFVVLCVWGSRYAKNGKALLTNRNYVNSMDDLDPLKPNLWYVVDRKNGKGVVAKFEGDAFFCFHTANAWEERSLSNPFLTDVVVDLVAYENLDVIKRYYYESIKSTSPASRDYIGDKGASTRGRIHRWRLPSINSSHPSSFNKATLDFTAPAGTTCDLPAFNPRYISKPSRYIYGATDRGYSTFFDGLIKYDTRTHNTLFWNVHGHNPGEPIFVPNPEGLDEDDGVLLSVVLDGYLGKSYLLVLDAWTMKEIGRASMECAVGFGFHGTHFSDREIPTVDASETIYRPEAKL